MSLLLAHSPADVVRYLLLALGLGADPDADREGLLADPAWPVYATNEPPTPDNCVTVYDVAGLMNARLQVDGSWSEYPGIQVRVRAATHQKVGDRGGWDKAREIAAALDTGVVDYGVTVGDHDYLVHSLSRTSGPLALGKESPTSKRSLFTINYTVCLKDVTEV